MESYYEDRIHQLETRINNAQTQESKTSDYLSLIQTYDNFIKSTLIDETLIDLYVGKLFFHFQQMDISQSNPAILYPYIKMSVKYGRLEGIDKLLFDVIRKKNRISDKFLLIELYYKQSKFKELYAVLQSIDKT